MSSAVSQIREELERAGWSFRDDISVSQLDGLLSCSYAALGLLIAENARDAADRWTACQAEIASLRSNPAIGSDRDLYLLILIPEIDAYAMDYLPAIINDTHVCRKLVLELMGRHIPDALKDIPFVAMERLSEDPAEANRTPACSADLPLPDALLADLSKRSPSKVLDAMLAGTYDNGSSDAN